jgi:hypothetical protein
VAEYFGYMSGSNEPDAEENAGTTSVGGKREEITGILNDINREFSDRVGNTVEVVDSTANDVGSYLDAVGQGTRDVLHRVLDELSEYIRENDVQVELSGHKIHIEGDEEGLRKAEAELTQALKNKDVEVQYDRDGGLDVKFE